MSDLDSLIFSFKEAFYNSNNEELLRINSLFLTRISSNPKLQRKLSFPEYLRFKSEVDLFDECWRFMDLRDWTLVSDTNNIKLEALGDGTSFFTKSTVVVNQGFFPVLCVLSALDLVPKWVSVLKRVVVIAEPTITRKLARFHFWFPWPMSDRQCIIEFNALPIPEKNACMITMRTPLSENYLDRKIPQFDDGEVQMSVRTGCLYAQSLDENTTKIVFVVNADGNIVKFI
jgi:hypothetical protein